MENRRKLKQLLLYKEFETSDSLFFYEPIFKLFYKELDVLNRELADGNELYISTDDGKLEVCNKIFNLYITFCNNGRGVVVNESILVSPIAIYKLESVVFLLLINPKTRKIANNFNRHIGGNESILRKVYDKASAKASTFIDYETSFKPLPAELNDMLHCDSEEWAVNTDLFSYEGIAKVVYLYDSFSERELILSHIQRMSKEVKNKVGIYITDKDFEKLREQIKKEITPYNFTKSPQPVKSVEVKLRDALFEIEMLKRSVENDDSFVRIKRQNEEYREQINILSTENKKLLDELNKRAFNELHSESPNEDEELETQFTATPMQTILLFRELGLDFTNASIFNKTRVKKMLSILTTKSEGNIYNKLTVINDNSRYVQNDLEIIKNLLKDIKN